MSGAPDAPDAAAPGAVTDPDRGPSAGGGPSTGRPDPAPGPTSPGEDPLAALVRLVETPSPSGAPSAALAAWARAADAGAPAGPVADPGSDPDQLAAPPEEEAAADAASPRGDATPAGVTLPESPFAVLTLEDLGRLPPTSRPAAGSAAPSGPGASPVTRAAERGDGAAPAASSPAGPEGAADRASNGAGHPGEPEAGSDVDAPAIGEASGPRSIGRFWTYGFPALVVALALLIPVLFTVGKNTVLQSTDGRVLGQVTDPAAPGWQAITDPTPTMLLVQTDAEGTATGLTVMTLTGEGSGGMIFIPMTTVLELPGVGSIPLDAAFERAGLDGLQKSVEGVLGVGMAEVAVVDPAGWADLVAPLGTLDVENPDDVRGTGPGGERTVLFPKGTITLTPDQVAPYLETVSPGENGLNLLVRQQAFWDAWLRAVGTSTDPAVVPGESTSGLGRFVRALAADRVDMAPLPVTSASIPGSDLAVYLPVTDQVTSLVARLVPFPIGAPPGARPRVRLLDGVGTLDHGLGAVANVVAAGGQVDQIGNAESFGQAVTRFTYSDDARLPEVERLRAGIGVGEIVKVPSGQTAIDVTITLGADYAAQPPPSLAPVTTAVR